MPTTYKEIKGVRQTTFRTGEAPTHLIGLNRTTGMWEVIKSSNSPEVSHAKRWAHNFITDHYPRIPYTWLGCQSNETIQETFTQRKAS